MLTIYFLQAVCDHSSHIFMSEMLVQSMTLVFFVQMWTWLDGVLKHGCVYQLERDSE